MARTLLLLVALVVIVGGAVVAVRSQVPPPSATSPTPLPTASPAPTFDAGAPSPTATPRGPTETLRVYFPRDELPPVGADVRTEVRFGPTHEGYIRARFEALLASAAAPVGAFNPLSALRTHPTVRDVRVEGDLATVDWNVPLGGGGSGDWGIGGSAATRALIQQMVYTATEEPGIRRALFTENGGKTTIVDQVQIDRPAARENVFGYDKPGSADPLSIEGATPQGTTLTTSASVEEVAPAMARFVITLGGPAVAPPARILPGFSVNVLPTTGGLPGKYELDVTIPGATDGGTKDTTVDKTPLRWYVLGRGSGVTRETYRLGLDDLRPWRAMVLYAPTRIVIDVGGVPGSVSVDGNTAIYAPVRGGDVARTFHLAGAARAFEATYLWRVKDAFGKVVAGGPGQASIGTSALWGAIEMDVTLPSNVSGFVTLEVYQVSPKDGSEVSQATAPLRIRP